MALSAVYKLLESNPLSVGSDELARLFLILGGALVVTSILGMFAISEDSYFISYLVSVHHARRPLRLLRRCQRLLCSREHPPGTVLLPPRTDDVCAGRRRRIHALRRGQHWRPHSQRVERSESLDKGEPSGPPWLLRL